MAAAPAAATVELDSRGEKLLRGGSAAAEPEEGLSTRLVATEVIVRDP